MKRPYFGRCTPIPMRVPAKSSIDFKCADLLRMARACDGSDRFGQV
jgi:hypothetical protein